MRNKVAKATLFLFMPKFFPCYGFNDYLVDEDWMDYDEISKMSASEG